MGEERFPDALRILDFYHPAENIYSFGKSIFFRGSETVYPLGGRTDRDVTRQPGEGSAEAVGRV
jgi:hypothetical protein